MERREFLGALGSAAVVGAAPSRPPNVVLINADDLGYGDLGCYGSPIPTPNLDRLAAEGARFTHFYSTAPSCSPSRAALLTGRYPTRVNVPQVLFPKDEQGLHLRETTLASMLKPKGYRTACVGKWHLGHQPAYLPAARGFDQYFGIPYSNDMEPPVLLRQADGRTETVAARADMDSLMGQYTSEAVQFIDSAKDSPFLLYLPHTFPHIPLGASAKFRQRPALGLYGAVIEELDASVGEVLAALKQHNLDANTLVMFTSDNGWWFQGSPGPLRGRKGTTLEGGVRVPFLARFPGRVARAKTVAGVASTIDVLPTVAAFTGAGLPDVLLDGKDISDLLAGRKSEIDRDPLLLWDGWHLQCARWRQWKIHFSRWNTYTYSPLPAGGRVNLPLRPPELYDVVRDVSESYDVAPSHPGVVRQMEDEVLRLLAGFPAPVTEAWGRTLRLPTRPLEPGRLPVPAEKPQ
jgi:arylsulfatase